jgi:hypothetical protein
VPDEPDFDPRAIFDVLARHHVDHIVIGGVAANLHGSDVVTFDVDITPSSEPDNLDRLSSALRDLDARIYVDGIPEGLAFEHSGASLAKGRVWNLETRYGRLDINMVPSGTSGYDDLRVGAIVLDLGGVSPAVASLDDIIRSKEAADRPKDRIALPRLRYLRELQGDGR